MQSLYVDSVLDDLKQAIKNSEGKCNISITSSLGDSVPLPAIIVALSWKYLDTIDEKNYTVILSDDRILEKEYDYNDSLPAQISVSFICQSKNINDLVEMETFIEDYFSSRKELYVQPPKMDDVRVPFFITPDSGKKPVRRTLQNNIFDNVFNQEPSGYETTFFTQGEIVPWFFFKIHSAQLELDKDFERDVFCRAAILECIKTEFQEIDDGSDSIKKKIDSINAVLEEIRSALSDYPPFDSFIDVYNIIVRNGCDAKEAIDIAKMEKEDSMRKRLSAWKDDSTVIKYTDAIISDFCKKLPDNINFFGGSKYTDTRIINPMVACFSNIDYFLTPKKDTGGTAEKLSTDFTLKYKKATEDGTVSSHEFALNAFPCRYQLNILIYDTTEDGVNFIIKKLVDLYGGQPIEMRVPDSRAKGEYILFNFSISQERSPITKSDNHYCGNLRSDVFIFPYDIHGYSKEDICENTRMQLRLLQQVEICYHCREILTWNKRDIKTAYDSVMKGRPTFLGANPLNAEDTKKVRSFVVYGTPVDRDLLNSAFGIPAKIYTELYDNFKDKWSIDKIMENVQAFINYFDARKDRLLDCLSIPDHVDVNVKTAMTPFSDNPRSREGVRHLTYCVQENGQLLEEALKEYPEYVEYAVEQYREEEERRRAQRAAMREGIGNFVKGSATVATGVAVGNKLSGNTVKGSNSTSGKTHAVCGVGCPNYKNGKCTVGSDPSMCKNGIKY